MRGRVVRMVAGVILGAALVATPSSAASPDDTFELVPSATTVTQGDVFAIEGACCPSSSAGPATRPSWRLAGACSRGVA